MSLKNWAVAVMATSTIALAAGGDYDFSSRRAPSESAPVANPPQLIILGSDDNTSAEGMKWIIDYLESKQHADGSKLRMSFYSNTQTWGSSSQAELLNQHKRAYDLGFEVSNHTDQHVYCVEGTGSNQKRLGIPEIEAQQQKTIDAMKAIGIAESAMKGFRTPYLAYSDSTFSATVNKGFTYDCSINEGIGWGDALGNAIGSYVWPYTLDTDMGDGNYAPGNDVRFSYWNQTYDAPVRQHSGLWELPCYMYVAPESVHDHMDQMIWDSTKNEPKYDHGGKVTGLDYNMWARPGGGWMLDKDQSIATLKNTLDQMYAGNRTPMTVGMHSQYYVEYPEDTAFVNIQSATDRRAVLEAFIDYALQKADDIYFVSGAQAIAYCMKPVAAPSFDPDAYLPDAPVDTTTDTTVVDTTTDTTVTGEAVDVFGLASWYISADGIGSAGSIGDSSDASVAAALTLTNPTNDTSYDNYISLGAYIDESLEGLTAIEVTYSSDKELLLSIGDSASTYGYSTKTALAAGTNKTVKVSVPADIEKIWGDGTLDLKEVTGFSLDATVAGEATNVVVSGVKLYGYTAPVDTTDTTVTDTTTDTTTTDTTVTDTSSKGEAVSILNILSYYGAYYDSTDANANATAEEMLDADTITSVKFSLANGDSWASAELAMDSMFTTVTHVEIKYSATTDYKMVMGMPSTGDNGSAHFVTLSKDESTLLVPVSAFKQPSWVAEDTATPSVELDLSVVNALGFELPDGVASGDITISSVTLYGYPKPEITAVKALAKGVSAPLFTGIAGNKMNVAVPSAGRYTVSLFSLKGQKIGELAANLNAGNNQVPMNSITLGSQMLIVQISGNGFNTVHKAMIK